MTTLWGQEMERMRRKVLETRELILPLAYKHRVMAQELEAVLKVVEQRYDMN